LFTPPLYIVDEDSYGIELLHDVSFVFSLPDLNNDHKDSLMFALDGFCCKLVSGAGQGMLRCHTVELLGLSRSLLVR
jgi:hypothetical protein